MASSNPEDMIPVSSLEEDGTTVRDTLKSFITCGNAKIVAFEKKLAVVEEEKAYGANSYEAQSSKSFNRFSQLEDERKKNEELETRQAQMEKELREARDEVQQLK